MYVLYESDDLLPPVNLPTASVWVNHTNQSSIIQTLGIIMPPRLNKRQLREQEELSTLRPADDRSDVDAEETPGVDRPTMVRYIVVVRVGS